MQMSYRSFLTALLLSSAARSDSFLFAPDVAVPDGLASGIADSRTISSSLATLTDINVTLTLLPMGDGGYNGDLYMSLLHESGFTVLLNRVGHRSDSNFGYGDAGLNLTLDDQAGADVHTYRLTLNGNHTTPLTDLLDSPWQPDGRTEDPATVLSTSSRTTSLGAFNGLNPNGTWTLFVADVQSGGQLRLAKWGLEIQGTAEVPEAGVTLPALLAAAAGLQYARSRNTKTHRR